MSHHHDIAPRCPMCGGSNSTWSMTGRWVCSPCFHGDSKARGQEDGLRELFRLIADDSYAMSFQSLGAYRSALLARIVELYKSPVQMVQA